MNYSSDSLIATIRLRAGIPQSALISDQNILEVINYELRQTILPLVIEAGAEYYVTFEDFEINTEGIYEIPALAMGKKLRDVQVVGMNNTPKLRSVLSILPQISLSNLSRAYFPNQWYYNQLGFVIRGNKLTIYPPNTRIPAGYLRMYYYRRPNECVLESQGAQITVTSPTQFVVGAVPAAFGLTPNIDIIQQTPSFDIAEDCENIAASVSGTTFTVPTTENMTTGDYVNLTGQTSFPQMPVDLQNMLIQTCCMRMYEILRDEQRLTTAAQMFDKMRMMTLKLISPRVDGRQIKITSQNSISNFI